MVARGVAVALIGLMAAPAAEARGYKGFDPAVSFAPKTLGQLNQLTHELNQIKHRLSSKLDFYLRFPDRYPVDISRRCRALAVPDAIVQRYWNYLKDARPLKKVRRTGDPKRAQALRDALFAVPYDRTVSGNARLIDIGELGVYADMYDGIDQVWNHVPEHFPSGNPFDEVMELLRLGAVIARYKYVAHPGGKRSARDQMVTYHRLAEAGGPDDLLAVHIEGDDEFSLKKRWGEGDEKLVPVSPKHSGTIVRWGETDRDAALQGKKPDEPYLY